MQPSVLRRVLPRLAILLIALTIGAILTRGDSGNNVSAAGNWSANTQVTVTPTTTGSVADYVAVFDVPAGELNFSSVVTLTPQAGQVAPDGGGDDPLLGDVVGQLSSATFLGLTNNACASNLTVTFTFQVATTDNSAANEIAPSKQGDASTASPTGTLAPLFHDVNTLSDAPDNADGGSEPPSAISAMNGIPGHVDRYPKYLNTLFDPDTAAGPKLPLAPYARYSGGQNVANTAVVLTFLVFAPGAFATPGQEFSAPHPLGDLAALNLGYSSVSVLQDPTAEPAPGAITDFCSPLNVTTTVYGQARTNPCVGSGGLFPCNNDNFINNPTVGALNARVRYSNPVTAGTHFYGGFQQSLRDSDGDGYENALDTCPYNVNTDLSPRVSSGPDLPTGDMLDSSCDPTPSGAGSQNNNADGDSAPNGGLWLNAQDNCPLIANPDNNQLELDQLENVRRPRGGFETDGLGDLCDGAETSCGDALDNDVAPSGPDGLVNDGCPTVGASGAETVCTGNVDNDGDGFVNDGCPAVGAAEAGAACSNYVSDDDDTGDTVINASDTINDGCPTVGTAAEPGCLNNFDDDADTVINDGCPSSSMVSNGHFHTTFGGNSPEPVCIGGTDVDLDGWCAAPLAADNPIIDPNDGDADITPEHYALVRFFPVAHSGSGANPPASREPLQVCNDGIDNDGDGATDLLEQDGPDGGVTGMWDCNPRSVTLPTADTDGDGYPDANEIYIGTDPLGRCEKTGTGVSQSSDWPADHVGGATSGDKITLTDISTYTATPKRFNTKPGDANFLPRYDVNPGTTTPGATQNWIVLTDLSNISSLVPAMFGVKAFGGPTCAAHLTLND